MTKMFYLNPRRLIADEGKVLTNGEVYSNVVYLGKDEDPDNWQEVDETEVQQEAESEVTEE